MEKHTENFGSKFGAVEYGVFGAVLVLPALIGIFHGCFGAKQKTTDQFLMASRQMTAWPMALSLVCSFISPITLLGNASEIYLYGTQIAWMMACFIPTTLALIYLYVPVYFNLKINSAFEYLRIRFSKGTSFFVSILAIIYLVAFTSVMAFGPSLALQQVTGIDLRLTTAAIFLVGIFYSAIGGLKAVVWVDVLQVLVMFISLTAIVIKGSLDEGGLGVVWGRAQNASRIEFFNFDPDPRTRHTVWTGIIGGYFYWMPMYAATQQRIQRYLAMKSLKTVRKAQILSTFGNIIFSLLCLFAGVVIYARYYQCDPLQAKVITKSDQLLPLLAIQTLSNIPGLAGVFVAGLTSASLSYVSGALTGLASILTYDYIRKYFPNIADEKLVVCSKLAVVVFGCISFGLVFVVEKMGNILPVTASMIGAVVGPTLGIFSLGMFFPWANAKGALAGILTSAILMVSYAIGGFVAKTQNLLPDQRLPLSVAQCPSSFGGNNFNSTLLNPISSGNWKDQEYSPIVQILSISYLWHPMIGAVGTVFFGLVFSWLFSFGDCERKPLQAELISPPFYSLWKTLFPKSIHRFVQAPISIEVKKEEEPFIEMTLKTFGK